MNILYIDIDSLRPDHLGCHGYHRPTSPNIDRLAANGVRFTECHVSDAPCLPSRTALFSGCHGFRTGVVNHGGAASQPRPAGARRGFADWFGVNSWPSRLRQAGYHTATISPFGDRHSAWHWYAGFSEIQNSGRRGNENADEVSPVAIDWIRRRGNGRPWFLHLNFWDPHTPYRVPDSMGNPFAGDPLPAWYSEEIRQLHWAGCGPHCAREAMGYTNSAPPHLQGRSFPRQPWTIDSMDAARRVFDGYDCGVRYADEHIGRVLNALSDGGLLENTAILVSSDHGENLGELNVYGDHQTADRCTTRVPAILTWPDCPRERRGTSDEALLYQFDLAATLTEMVGATCGAWDARPLSKSLSSPTPTPHREHLIVSQGAWCLQRGVRWKNRHYIHTWDPAWHDYPESLLFDVEHDPHELKNLADLEPESVSEAKRILRDWKSGLMREVASDPFDTVLAEGGPLHAREAGDYAGLLRATGRAALADALEQRPRPSAADLP